MIKTIAKYMLILAIFILILYLIFDLTKNKNYKSESFLDPVIVKSSTTSSTNNDYPTTTYSTTNTQTSTVEKEKISDIKTTNTITSKQVTSTKSSTISSSNPITSTVKSTTSNRSQVISTTTITTTIKKQIWEELGISEDDYYNKPMFSWEKVDFNTMNECREYGINYEPYLNGEVLFSCSIVTSFSGKYLGIMFSTEKLQ